MGQGLQNAFLCLEAAIRSYWVLNATMNYGIDPFYGIPWRLRYYPEPPAITDCYQNVGHRYNEYKQETALAGEGRCRWVGPWGSVEDSAVNTNTNGWKFEYQNRFEAPMANGLACVGAHCKQLSMLTCENRQFPDGRVRWHYAKLDTCEYTELISNKGEEAVCSPGYGVVDIKCNGRFCSHLKLRCCKFARIYSSLDDAPPPVVTTGSPTPPFIQGVSTETDRHARYGFCDPEEVLTGIKCAGQGPYCATVSFQCSQLVYPKPAKAAVVGRWEKRCSMHGSSSCELQLVKSVQWSKGAVWNREAAKSMTASLESGIEIQGVGGVKSGVSFGSSLVSSLERMLERQRSFSEQCTVGVQARKVSADCPNPVLYQFHLSGEFEIFLCDTFITCSSVQRPKCMPGCCKDAKNCQTCLEGGQCG